MPNGRPIDTVPLLGAAIIVGAVAWWVFRRPKTKFQVGQRVALWFQLATEGTVIQVQPSTNGEQFYIVQFDNIAGPSVVPESHLVAA